MNTVSNIAPTIPPRIRQLIKASSLNGLTDEEQEIRYERSDFAAMAFRQLSASRRNMLLAAASHSNMLFLALSSGNWEAAVRALRGYVVRAIPKDEQAEYRELIVALNVLTPHGLELTGHKQVVEEDERELVAAAA